MTTKHRFGSIEVFTFAHIVQTDIRINTMADSGPTANGSAQTDI
jgi:hypothetical protein